VFSSSTAIDPNNQQAVSATTPKLPGILRILDARVAHLPRELRSRVHLWEYAGGAFARSLLPRSQNSLDGSFRLLSPTVCAEASPGSGAVSANRFRFRGRRLTRVIAAGCAGSQWTWSEVPGGSPSIRNHEHRAILPRLAVGVALASLPLLKS